MPFSDAKGKADSNLPPLSSPTSSESGDNTSPLSEAKTFATQQGQSHRRLSRNMSQTYLSTLNPILPATTEDTATMTNTTPTPPPADITPPSPAPKAKKESMWKSEVPVISPEQAELNRMIIADAKDRAAAKVTRRTKFLVYQYRAGEEPVIPNGLAVRLGKEIDYILSRNPELQKTVVPIPKGKGSVEVHATDVLTKKQKADGVTAGGLAEGEEGANVAQVKVPFGVRVSRGLSGGYQDLVVLSQKP